MDDNFGKMAIQPHEINGLCQAYEECLYFSTAYSEREMDILVSSYETWLYEYGAKSCFEHEEVFSAYQKWLSSSGIKSYEDLIATKEGENRVMQWGDYKGYFTQLAMDELEE